VRGEAGSGVRERERLEVGGLCEEGVAGMARGGWAGVGTVRKREIRDSEKERERE
jgi:hypothetical protein